MVRPVSALIALASVAASLGDHVLYQAAPLLVDIASVNSQIDLADISDLESGDFDGDGAVDVAVAWFVTDFDNASNNLRRLTVFWGGGLFGLERGDDLDLFVPDPNFEELSIFRNGSADIAGGDFDGDGDLDIAVTPFFGDELWIVENLGSRRFTGHVKFPFVFNTSGNFQTPPEALAADFDGDGRDDLVYVADPTLHVLGLPLHFWKTEGSIADMQRVEWIGLTGVPFVGWTRSLAVGDYNGDGRADVCYSGSSDLLTEDSPIVVFWYDFDAASESFLGHAEFPSFIVSDVATIRLPEDCRDGVVCADRGGTQLAFYGNRCTSGPDFTRRETLGGFAGVSSDDGMPIVVADLDSDGRPDVVTKQRHDNAGHARRVEIALAGPGAQWSRLDPTPVSTMGLGSAGSNSILRPRGLLAANLFGDARPEIVASFGSFNESGGFSRQGLQLAIWSNACRADIDGDGDGDLSDLALLLGAMVCEDSEFYIPAADLNHDGCVGLTDLSLLLSGFGCEQ